MVEAKIYQQRHKSIVNHPPIVRESPDVKRNWVKHPGRELEFLRKKDGVMVCAICILQESETGAKDIKDKFWVKHPGYEKNFFCKNWVKGIWEKWIKIHSDHDIVTVVLESQKLQKDLEKFKGDFSVLNQDWDQLHKQFDVKRDNFEYEVDKTCKSIGTHFEELMKKLEESKKKYIEAFKLRAKDEMQEFLEVGDNFGAFYANIKQKENEIQSLDQLYTESNDFDLVKESSLKQSDLMFKEFCPEYQISLDEYKRKFSDLESKFNYTFHFETGTDNDEVINSIHKNIKIKMKIEEDEVKDDEGSDDSDISLNERAKTVKNTRTKGETGHTGPLTFKQLYRIDKARKKLLTYDLNEKKLHKVTYIEPTPENTPTSEMDARHMSNIQFKVLSEDSKSCCLDTGDIYVFGATETKFSSGFYIFDGTELEECQNLIKKRKKISWAPLRQYIYITGEFENISIKRTTLERYDTEKQVFEEIAGLNKQSNYLLWVVSGRYLFAFPYSINSYKVLVLDLEHLESPNEESKEKWFKGEWSKHSPKNPNNINLYLSYKSSVIQISHNEVFLSSLKYGYIYNTDSHQFTGQYNYAQDDEFYDGFYLKNNSLYGYGTKGIQRFDLVLKKWQVVQKNAAIEHEEPKQRLERAMSDSDDSF